MRDSIESRGRSNTLRLRDRQSGIQHRKPESPCRIAARKFCMSLCIRYQRICLRFASSARRSGYTNHWKQRLPGLAVTVIVAHSPAVAEEKVDSFCAVERAATSECD